MKIFSVISAVITNEDNKVFICQRNHGALKGHYEFPGGKKENGETDQDTLIREIKEELNTVISVEEFICENKIKTSEKNITLRSYICKVKEGNLISNVHSQCLFVSLEELKNYSLCENEQKTTQYLIENKSKFFN